MAKNAHISPRELFVMLESLALTMDVIRGSRGGGYDKLDPVRMSALDEAHGLFLKLEEQWDDLPSRERKTGASKPFDVRDLRGISNPQHRRQWMPSMVEDEAAHWPRSEVQSLLFSVDHFTAHQAKAWAQKHGYRYGAVDTTEHYHRLRQFEPTGAPCRTMELPGTHPVVKAVVCRGQ